MLTDPEPLELGQDVQRLEHFQVEHLHIRKPELQQKGGKVKDLERTSDVNLRCQEKHRLNPRAKTVQINQLMRHFGLGGLIA